MSIIPLFECSILGPSQMVKYLENQQRRAHEKSTIHQYPRQKKQRAQNPMNYITLHALMLPLIPEK